MPAGSLWNILIRTGFAPGEHITRQGLRPLILVAAAVALGWAFAELADEVVEGTTQEFDQWVFSLLFIDERPRGPRWFWELARDITALGGFGILTLITMFIVGLLMLLKRGRTAIFVGSAALGGAVMSTILKQHFARPRPVFGHQEIYTITASFPSGHSMLSAVIYITLGALLAGVFSNRQVKIYIITSAALLTFLVGVTRIYLGVHWPSDVAAGWLVGVCWALVWWLAARRLRERGQLEQS